MMLKVRSGLLWQLFLCFTFGSWQFHFGADAFIFFVWITPDIHNQTSTPHTAPQCSWSFQTQDGICREQSTVMLSTLKHSSTGVRSFRLKTCVNTLLWIWNMTCLWFCLSSCVSAQGHVLTRWVVHRWSTRPPCEDGQIMNFTSCGSLDKLVYIVTVEYLALIESVLCSHTLPPAWNCIVSQKIFTVIKVITITTAPLL